MSPQGAESIRPEEVAERDCLERPESDEPAFGRTWRRGGEALSAAMHGLFAGGARNIALQYHRLDHEDDDEESQR